MLFLLWKSISKPYACTNAKLMTLWLLIVTQKNYFFHLSISSLIISYVMFPVHLIICCSITDRMRIGTAVQGCPGLLMWYWAAYQNIDQRPTKPFFCWNFLFLQYIHLLLHGNQWNERSSVTMALDIFVLYQLFLTLVLEPPSQIVLDFFLYRTTDSTRQTHCECCLWY